MSVSSSSWGLGRAAVCDCDTPWNFLLPFLTQLFYSLLLCGLFCEAICCMSFQPHFVLVFFSPFSIAITSFGEERANLGAFRTFVRFVLV